jgi:hypothetical protein
VQPPAAVAAPRPSDSAPIATGTLQDSAKLAPSGPVPAATKVASGSGPHDDGAKLPIPTNPAEILSAWSRVLNRLEAKHLTTVGTYEPARVMAWTQHAMELGYPPQFEMLAEVAEDKDKLDILRKVVQDMFDHAPKITVRKLAESEIDAMPARSVLESSRERTSAERARRESEAREHPITKHVLQTFGAHIKEIKTDV